MINRAFTRYIGIDYSGAQAPTASLKGLGSDVQGSLSKSTHAGIFWLWIIRRRLAQRADFLALRRPGHLDRPFDYRRRLSVAVASRLRA